MAIMASVEHTVHYLIYTYLLFVSYYLTWLCFQSFFFMLHPGFAFMFFLMYTMYTHIFSLDSSVVLYLFVAHHPCACMTFFKWNLFFCIRVCVSVCTLYVCWPRYIPFYYMAFLCGIYEKQPIFEVGCSYFCNSLLLSCSFRSHFPFSFLLLLFFVSPPDSLACIVCLNCRSCCYKTLKQQPKSNFMAS